MFAVEFANGCQLVFESSEALACVLEQVRAGTPVVVRSEKDGRREVVWAPGDED